MTPAYSASLALCLVLGFASGVVSGQFRENSEGQSSSVSDEDETNQAIAATGDTNNYESSDEFTDEGTNFPLAGDETSDQENRMDDDGDNNEDEDDEFEDEKNLRQNPSLPEPKFTRYTNTRILDIYPKNVDENSVQPVDQDQGFRQKQRGTPPLKLLDDFNDENGAEKSNSSNDDFQLSGKTFNYLRNLHKLTAFPAVSKYYSPMLKTLVKEKNILLSKLQQLEDERLKLRLILVQLKGILRQMHQHSDHIVLNMTSHEVRVARLRNLFLLLSAITNFTPLTQAQLNKFNFDVGLFDPKITEESKTAMVQKITALLRNKLSLFSTKEDTEPYNSFPPLYFRSHPTPSPTPDTQKTSLETKLRRLRNIYLLVRPIVTGVNLTNEELREVCESQDGFFEPGLLDSKKIEIITRVAENIRTSHLSQKLIEESKKRAADVSSTTTTETPDNAEAETPSHRGNPVVFIKMTSKQDEENVHVSGKIRMDLDVEGDINPANRDGGLLSKLI